MKKGNLFPAFLLGLALLAGCAPQTSPSLSPSSEPEVTGYTLRDVQGAVLTVDAMMTDCYSYTLKEGYGTPGTDDSQFYLWTPLDLKHDLSQGDIVAVLGEDDGVSRVVIPYGDLPWLYGYIPGDLLSTEQADIESGNQAIIDDCETYDAPNGVLLHPGSARVKIISYEGEWTNVQEYGTGSDPYWVRSGDLSFDFSASIPDWPT